MIQAILFDFDGVLVDSHEATIAYFQETLNHFGFPTPDKSVFTPLLGLKTLDITKALLPNLSEEEILPIFEYSKKMSIQYVPKIQLFPNAKEILTELGKTYKLALATSRSKETVELLFKQYNLNSYFQAVVDREDITKHKPDPEGIYIALHKIGVDVRDAVFIGDTKEDVIAAHNAPMPCVIISNKDGYPDAEYTINTLKELPDLLIKINK